MPVDGLGLLRDQFEVTWALARYHLERVTDESLLWEPASSCWTVRRDLGGRWRPDWQVPEPDPVPVPTAAWVSWHLGWWWTVAAAHVEGRTPPEREDIVWPGDAAATVAWLEQLRERWSGLLDLLDEPALNEVVGFPWRAEAGRTVADLVAWANIELMKNVAEIGQLTMIRTASG